MDDIHYKNMWLGVVEQAYNHSLGKAEVKGLQVLGQPESHNESLSEKRKKNVYLEFKLNRHLVFYLLNLACLQGSLCGSSWRQLWLRPSLPCSLGCLTLGFSEAGLTMGISVLVLYLRKCSQRRLSEETSAGQAKVRLRQGSVESWVLHPDRLCHTHSNLRNVQGVGVERSVSSALGQKQKLTRAHLVLLPDLSIDPKENDKSSLHKNRNGDSSLVPTCMSQERSSPH